MDELGKEKVTPPWTPKTHGKMKVVGSHGQIYTPVVLETTASRLKGKGGPACTFQPKTITDLHLAQHNVLDASSPKQMAGSTFFSLFITAKLLRFCTTTCKHSKLPHPGGHLACDCGLEEVEKRVTTLKGIHQGVRIPSRKKRRNKALFGNLYWWPKISSIYGPVIGTSLFWVITN